MFIILCRKMEWKAGKLESQVAINTRFLFATTEKSLNFAAATWLEESQR